MFGGAASAGSGGAPRRGFDAPKPPTNGTALPASPPMWEISSTSFTKLTIDQLTETCLIGNPDVAVARAGVIKYFSVRRVHVQTMPFVGVATRSRAHVQCIATDIFFRSRLGTG